MAKRYLTKEKFEELKKELEYLKKVKRKEIAELLRHTASFGDLSENFAYQQAKEEQALLEAKIRKLEEILSQAKILEKSKNKNKVEIGCFVVLELVGKKSKEKFQIVDPLEADPLNGKISINSPLGKELIGKKVGQKVKIKIDSNSVEYRIVKIE